MRIVAMVPSRLGSKRIKRKGLRLLGNKPLLQWIVDTARDSDLFDALYVNSESSEIRELAMRLNVDFYHRPQHLATDTATNDDFMADFMENVAQPGDFTHVAQLNPTSPFLTVDDMRGALNLAATGATTVISVRRLLAECRAYMREINYDPTRQMLPSQELAPVHYFCNGIFVWEVDTFLRAYKMSKGAAVYGPLGQTEYLELTGDSTIDLDTEEDWQKAELVVRMRNEPVLKARYWTPTLMQEWDGMQAVICDGVSNSLNASVDIGVRRRLALSPDESTCCRVVDTRSSTATIISQAPGEGNRPHYHPDCDEWWYILHGTYEFVLGFSEKLIAVEGDIVVVPRGVWHQITAVGDKRAVRLAVSREGAAHVYHD